MELLAVQRVLWVACLAAQVALIGAIFQNGIAKRYRFFVAYLAVEVCAGVVLLQIPLYTNAYAHAFRIYEMTMVVLRAGAVAELFERVCAHFPVIGHIRFALASFLVGLTGLVSLAAVRPATGLLKYPQTLALYIGQFETTVLSISLVLMWWFLTSFMSLRPTVRGNVALHWGTLAVYFGVGGLTKLVATSWSSWAVRSRDWVNIAMLACDLACFVVWLRGFSSVREFPPPNILSPEEASVHRMLRQTILQRVKNAGGQDFQRL